MRFRLALLLLSLPAVTRVDAAEKPNILLLVADDLGWNDVGWRGGPPKTPNLDALVKAGVELDRHYVQPVCTPTRTALMTGRAPSRFGPQALKPSNLRALPPGYPTVASALRAAGYETHVAGKWHLGSRPEWGPNHYGFAHSYGSLNGAVDPWKHLYRKGPYERTWHRDGVIFDETGNATELDPTLMAATGAKPVGDPKWDGLDRWAVMTGETSQPEPRSIYVPLTNAAAFLDGDWKLIETANGKSELYNLATDPSEKTDLAKTEPARLSAMKEKLAATRSGDIKDHPADLAGIHDF